MKIAVGLLLVALLIGGAVWAFVQGVGSGKPPLEEAAAVLEAKNRALALLENNDLADAFAPLRDVAKAEPDDRFGWQNLAVGGLLALESGAEGAAAEAARDAAVEGLSGMQRLAASEPVTYYLSGRRWRVAGEWKNAVEAFTQAAQAVRPDLKADSQIGDAGGPAEDKGAFLFGAYLAGKQGGDELAEAGRAALYGAAEEAERNLFILTNAVSEALEHDPGRAAEFLGSLVEAVRPLRAGMLKATRDRYDPVALLEEAKAAAEGGEAATASLKFRGVNNLLKAEPVFRSDAQDADPNLLEYVRLDLGERTYDRYAPAARAAFGPVAFGPAEDLGEGVAVDVADFDLDASSEAAVLKSDAGRWSVEIGGEEVAAGEGAFAGLRAVDLDNDFAENGVQDIRAMAGDAPCRTADVDLVLFGPAGLAAVRNKKTGDGRTYEVIPDAFAEVADLGGVTAVAIADIDAEGDLDVVAATDAGLRLLLNRGDGTFEDAAQPPDGGDVGGVLKLVPLDFDRDVDIDVLVLRDANPPVAVLENLRHGRTRLRAVKFLLGPGEEPADLAAVDADGNASWDVLLSTDRRGVLMRTFTLAPGRVKILENVTVPLSGPLCVGDFDNDGLADVLTGAGVSQGLAVKPFYAEPTAADVPVGRPLEFGGDRLLDVAVAEGGSVRLFPNATQNAGAAQAVTLLAQQVLGGRSQDSSRVNSYGLGTTLEVRAGGRVSTAVVGSQTTLVGLGDAKSPESLRVVWTNGIPGHAIDPPVDAYLCERQTLKGSCPYLYAWDGQQIAFVTDLLWAAPIGLQLADGVQAVPREWEHLAIPGEAVAERGGRYELRVTEELWEAAYFDRLVLTAVDHPEGTSLFTNEKVGPPAVARPRTFVFGEVTPADRVEAVHPDGERVDLTELASAADGRFAVPHRRKVTQGYVEPVGLEVPVPAGAEYVLLSGWVRPTDTSINVALSHDRRHEGPRPPVMRAWGAGERMEDVEPVAVGFPGGKTKTIVVPLGGRGTDASLSIDEQNRLASVPRTLRLDTTMEFAWDRVAFASGGDEARREHACRLVSADLRRRGFSKRIPERDGGPELYDYDAFSAEPEWPPLGGRFTRYGDVAGLLTEADDRLVVMGPGDEMALSLEAPEPPPAGWRRDFVLSCVGWDKDADLNTVYGDSSEPYPTLGVVDYPEPHDFDERADAAVQTRRMPAPVRLGR